MSLPTFSSARNEIFQLFYTSWSLMAPDVPVYWQGVDIPSVSPPVTGPWVRIFIEHTGSQQVSYGPTGARRYERNGQVTVQIFTPIAVGGGLTRLEELAVIARDAYEGVGTASGIFFRNSRISEVGVSEAWWQMNVVLDFQYDEMR
jgi:hypothetical protein